MITKSEIRPGAYYDSVVLMRLQRNLADLEGVDDAGVVMATPANLELLADADLLTSDGKIAKPDDLLIVVRAEKEKDADAAISQVDELIARRSSNVSTEYRPHSLAAAVKQLPDSKWVLISVPGRYAAGVAQEALDLDKHVFLYSDNVSIENELALKIKGREKGLLVMGPDCGTAIINGIGLGFANRVQKGVIGLVGASGTGLQAITSHVHNSGAGISQAIGTGGRDLKSKIGAITAIQGLCLLAEDEETKVIIIVSKPPSAEVVTRLLAVARGIDKPVVVNFLGYPPPGRQIGNLHFSTTLSETASMAIDISNTGAMVNIPKNRCRKGYLRGLFAGGTLAYEMMLGLQSVLSPLYSNVPVNPTQKLDDPLNSKAHTIVDLGEDLFTVGRLHPMMDNDLRIRRMQQEAKDPDTGMILLDIVLGEGSHPDPVSELLPVILDIKKKRTDMDFTALVIGTEEDPQGIESQINQWEEGGVKTFRNTVETVADVS
ncbi:MAG: acyl-CoA synthetase FdrA, partial [Chloroflexi bacterium]|nr:acyl-CoA synthetase FdrA [Chloroflexota bacterium]